ncbi:hypothetical protein OF83DRAFT_721993 [Amylostereum chailletii]|nr:hypothetical protein OF83DRAFT_721993 [Amylostereum chailletii]
MELQRIRKELQLERGGEEERCILRVRRCTRSLFIEPLSAAQRELRTVPHVRKKRHFLRRGARQDNYNSLSDSFNGSIIGKLWDKRNRLRDCDGLCIRPTAPSPPVNTAYMAFVAREEQADEVLAFLGRGGGRFACVDGDDDAKSQGRKGLFRPVESKEQNLGGINGRHRVHYRTGARMTKSWQVLTPDWANMRPLVLSLVGEGT